MPSTETLVHVNRNLLAMNRRDGGNRPAVSVRRGRSGKARYGTAASWDGPTRVVQAGFDGVEPLACGARVWVATTAEVAIENEVDYADAEAAGD